MEKGGPSPISPRHCRVRRRSSRCGPTLLTRGSDVGGAAILPSSGLAPLLLHYRATAPLRLQLAPAGTARASRLRPTTERVPERRPRLAARPSRGLEASPRIRGGPPAPPYRLTASGLEEIGRSRRSSRPIGHVPILHFFGE
ncbi:hypothetical protein NDU88_006421 [Pleurodeles waltl]|uniref:Uncharacterized protein n=1 Tax=Pleurodeles waltl TaxID=8319 RepID=A0AAV7RQ18_PLEWA|nr:hypothetical protein NDU88_006421 [Pleurodeles waltl]